GHIASPTRTLRISCLVSPYCLSPSFLLLRPRPPRSTLFPYTTLFRSIPREKAYRERRSGHCFAPAAGRFFAGHRIFPNAGRRTRSEEHTSELQSRENLVCRLLLEKKKQPPLLSTVTLPYQHLPHHCGM